MTATAAQRYNKRLNETLSPERIEAATATPQTQLIITDDGRTRYMVQTPAMPAPGFYYYDDNAEAIRAVRQSNDLTPCPVCKQMARWHNDDGTCAHDAPTPTPDRIAALLNP